MPSTGEIKPFAGNGSNIIEWDVKPQTNKNQKNVVFFLLALLWSGQLTPQLSYFMGACIYKDIEYCCILLTPTFQHAIHV